MNHCLQHEYHREARREKLCTRSYNDVHSSVSRLTIDRSIYLRRCTVRKSFLTKGCNDSLHVFMPTSQGIRRTDVQIHQPSMDMPIRRLSLPISSLSRLRGSESHSHIPMFRALGEARSLRGVCPSSPDKWRWGLILHVLKV